MRKKIEQLLSGNFEYEQPKLLFSSEKLLITLKAGETGRGELYLGTENNEPIRGYITSSSRRLVPGLGKFSGTTVCLPWGADAAGLNPGDSQEGWLCFTTSVGEYRLPFEIRTEEASLPVGSLQEFPGLAREDFREAFRLFTDPAFSVLLKSSGARERALYAGLSRQPVTYQHLEEFFIARGDKEAVSLTLPVSGREFYNLKESVQESFVVHRSGWGHLRLDVEARGDFLELSRRVVTDEDFIGSTYQVSYIVRREALNMGNRFGEIRVRSPYQELVFSVMASAGAKVSFGVRGVEKRNRIALVKDYLEMRMGDMDLKTWQGSSHYVLNQLREAGCIYPEYDFFEALLLLSEGEKEQAGELLKECQKTFSKEDMEQAGVYLFLCVEAGLYRDRDQAVSRLERFFDLRPESFPLAFALLHLDPLYEKPSRAAALLEGLFEKGCTSPLLYMEAWDLVNKDISILRKLGGFWVQVFLFAARRGRVDRELMMRIAYLSGYEKEFHPALYRLLTLGYDRYPEDETLEAICKYVMKGNPRKSRYFRWFSLAVERGLRITRLYEYYVETLDTSYQRELPRPLLLYFAYNDTTLGDAKKAYLYASVTGHKNQEKGIYDSYRKNMEEFAKAKLSQGAMNENYAILYQEFCSHPDNATEADRIAARLFTCRLYCDDPKIRQVIVRHAEMEKEEVFPCIHGVAYPRIYTKEAVVLFQDDKQRRYVSTVAYNLTPLMDEREIIPRVIEAGTGDAGVLLYYCENTVLTRENLQVFKRAALNSALSADYRHSLEKRILEYFRDHPEEEGITGELKGLNLREYAGGDRKILLELLIRQGLYPRAMALIEELGCEGVEEESLLKLASSLIHLGDGEEDEELISLASQVYRHGRADEATLEYLMNCRVGPLDELYSIWKSARKAALDTRTFEERILGLSMLTGNCGRAGEEVYTAYQEHGGRERVMAAYLTMKSYGLVVREQNYGDFMKKNLLLAVDQGWPVHEICRLALLDLLSADRSLCAQREDLVKTLLRECVEKGRVFAFFGRFDSRFLSPFQLDDRTFVECHAHPDARVTLHYALDPGLGKKPEYKTLPLKNMYSGIFTRTFTLFYGESLRYWFSIENGGKTVNTPERTITMTRVEESPQTRFALLNQMLAHRCLGREKQVWEILEEVQRRDMLVRELFVLESEEDA